MEESNRSAQAGMGSGVEGRGEQGASFGPDHSASPSPSVSARSGECSSRGPADPYRYSVILKWSDEDQTFVGRVPELPGCCFHGDTQVEAIGEAASAIACWIEAAWAAGNMIPEAARLSDADFPKWSPASGTEAQRAETRSGLVEDEGPVDEVKTPDLRRLLYAVSAPVYLQDDGTILIECSDVMDRALVQGLHLAMTKAVAETPSQSPDPLSQTVAPSTEEKE